MNRRIDFLVWALAQEGKAYIWGAKGPETFDCSGLATYGLYHVTNGRIDWRALHNANTLFHELEPTDTPAPGDLCFYGAPDHATHVMINYGDGRAYGANGGMADTSLLLARKHGSCVKFKPSVKYRPDFLGFRILPVDVEIQNGN